MILRSTLIRAGILILLVAAACSGRGGDDDEVAPELGDWIGMTDVKLVLKWGAPDSVYQMQDGSRILTWRHSRTENQGGEIYTVTETQTVDGKEVVVPITRQKPTITWRYECVTNFIVDPDGYVVWHTVEGNDCTTQPPPY